MANRGFRRNMMSLAPNPVHLFVNATIGSAGAVTLNALKSLGIYSITHDSTGVYSIKFGLNANSLDTYQRLISLKVTSLNATAPAWASVFVTSDASATGSGPKIVIKFLDIASAAVDPGSGEVLLMEILLSNSTAV